MYIWCKKQERQAVENDMTLSIPDPKKTTNPYKKKASLEDWMDVIYDGLAAKKSADLAADVEREINKVDGYVIWDTELDLYIYINDERVGWAAEAFSLIVEMDIEILQELFWKKPKEEDTFILERQIALHKNIIRRNVSRIRVIPCVQYEGEEPKLDFINAFKFDGVMRDE